MQINNIDIKTDPRFSIMNIADLLNIKILGQKGVEMIARCPFCGDSKSPDHGHLYLNTATNQYHCVRCGKGGYALGLYADLKGISKSQAVHEIAMGNRVTYSPQPLFYKENPVAPIEERDKVYTALLNLLELDSTYIDNLTGRGLTLKYITEKTYRSVPSKAKAVSITKKLLDMGFSLKGIPGFYKDEEGNWTFITYQGIFIPVRDYEGRIQGLQVRLNGDTKRKYRWFSSRSMKEGTRAISWIHITKGSNIKNITVITEGALKADVASFLSNAIFVGVAGVNAINGIEQAVSSIPKQYRQQICVAYDMDMMTNEWVLKARKELINKLKGCFPGTKITPLVWPIKHGKGIDDFLLNIKKGVKLSIKEKWAARQCIAIAK